MTPLKDSFNSLTAHFNISTQTPAEPQILTRGLRRVWDQQAFLKTVKHPSAAF